MRPNTPPERATAPPTPLAKTEAVRDLNYLIIGYSQQRGDTTFVRDCNFNLLDYSNPSGTFDALGRRLYPQPLPDVLLDRSPCKTK
jgi:hypothetical protein